MQMPWEIARARKAAPPPYYSRPEEEDFVIKGPPKEPSPQTRTQAAIDEERLDNLRNPPPTLPVGYRLRPDGTAERIPNLPPDRASGGLTAEDRGKFTRQRQGALGLKKRITEIESLYQNHFRGAGGDTVNPDGTHTISQPGLGSISEYAPGNAPIIGRPANKVFENAGGSLMGDLAAAYGLTAQQQNTPVELEIRFGPFIPKPGDRDEVIEAKIRRLKEVADEQERQALDALGVTQERNNTAAPPVPDNTPPTIGGDSPKGQMSNPERVPLSVGDTEQIDLASGKTQTINDPALAGVNAQVNHLLKSGATGKTIADYLRSVGVPPQQVRGFRDALKFRREHPGYRGDYSVNIDDKLVPMTRARQIQNDIGQSTAGAYAINAGDAVSLGTLDNLTENPALTRAGIQGIRQQHPYASLAGTVTGGATTAALGELGAAKLGFQGVRAATAGDAAFGAGYGAGSADEGNRFRGAVTGAATGVGGGVAGRAVASATGRALTGTRDAAARYLTERGIPLTVGQIAGRGGVVGRTVKAVEDALESVPLLGDAIKRRRAEGTAAFNSAAFREAGEPISDAALAIGEEGVEQAKAATSRAYDKALSGVEVGADRVFVRDMQRTIRAGQRLHPETAGSFKELVENEVAPALEDGTLTGEGYQALRQVIREERAAWKGKPHGRQYGQALRQLEGSLESLVRRQSKGTAEGLSRADRAYRLSGVVRDAVGRGKNTEGVFTPAQLGMAAEANAKKFGGASTTDRPFFDLQRAGQDILPSKVPNSGTADRIMAAGLLPALPGLVGAGGAATGIISPETAGIMAALGLPFTRAGQAAFQKMLVDRPDFVRQVGQQILSRKSSGGLFGAAGGVSMLPQE